MKTLFVTDPLAGLSADIDASVGLMDACQAEGAEVWVCEPADLGVCRRAAGRPGPPDLAAATAPRRRPPLGRRAALVRRGRARNARRGRDAARLVWLRIDPPVDARYLHTTYLLDLAAAAGVRVVNHPAGVRALHEKLLALLLPELCPATVVTSTAAEVEAFVGGVRHGGGEAGRRVRRHRRLAAWSRAAAAGRWPSPRPPAVGT